MRISEVTDDDFDHAHQLAKTGFWGKAGAGCLILSHSTGRFLFPYRSASVEQPHTYGTWGGAIDRGESPSSAVVREVREEAEYHGDILKILPLYVFEHSSGFRYYNFLVVVEDEFAPDLNWETESFVWVDHDKWPHPQHFGIQGILKDAKSVATIKAEVEQSLASITTDASSS